MRTIRDALRLLHGVAQPTSYNVIAPHGDQGYRREHAQCATDGSWQHLLHIKHVHPVPLAWLQPRKGQCLDGSIGPSVFASQPIVDRGHESHDARASGSLHAHLSWLHTTLLAFALFLGRLVIGHLAHFLLPRVVLRSNKHDISVAG